jgi:hypothetical protein
MSPSSACRKRLRSWSDEPGVHDQPDLRQRLGDRPKAFNGFIPRFNAISGNTTTGQQIIDAGGTGSDNFSVWLVVWDPNKVRGIYPKGTKAGLFHEDASDNMAASDGFPRGTVLYDASGNPYMGYRDHFEWNCGLSIKDYRYVVRICNISRSDLTKDDVDGRRPAGLADPGRRARAEPQRRPPSTRSRHHVDRLRRQLDLQEGCLPFMGRDRRPQDDGLRQHSDPPRGRPERQRSSRGLRLLRKEPVQ